MDNQDKLKIIEVLEKLGLHVYSDDADPRTGHPDPGPGLTSFWHCQNGTE